MIHKRKMQKIQRGRRFNPDSFPMRRTQRGLLSLRRLEIATEYKHVLLEVQTFFDVRLVPFCYCLFFLGKRLRINLIRMLCFSLSQDVAFFATSEKVDGSFSFLNERFLVFIFTPQFYIVSRSWDDNNLT